MWSNPTTHFPNKIKELSESAPPSTPIPGIGNIHADVSMEHMESLIHIASESASAGALPGRSILRDADQKGSVHELWSTGSRLTLLNELAVKADVIESAYNTLRAEYDVLAEKWEDPTGGLPSTATEDEILSAREEAYEKVAAFMRPENLHPRHQKLLSTLAESSEDTPSDLPTLRTVLTERLEAAATGHQKTIKGALSQQAIDNWAACVDMDEALADISRECVLASIEIERAASVGDAKAAYDTGVAAIRSVTAANSPHWTVAWGDESHDVNDPFPTPGHTAAAWENVPGSAVTVRARHPEQLVGDPIPGNCSISPLSNVVDASTGARVPFTQILRTPSTPAGSHEVTIRVPSTVTDPVTVTVKSRNICGPSTITFTLTP